MLFDRRRKQKQEAREYAAKQKERSKLPPRFKLETRVFPTQDGKSNPRHDVVVDVCGGPEVSIFGYKAALPASSWDGLVDQIRDILLRHYNATGQDPDSITFPIRFERS